VAGTVLLGRPDDHSPLAHAPQQLRARLRLELVSGPEVRPDEGIDLGQSALGKAAEGAHGLVDLGLGKAVVDPQAVLTGLHQARPPKHLQVARRVGEREARLGRQFLDRALALGKDLEHLEPSRVVQTLGDASDLVVEPILELTSFHGRSSIE